MAASSLQALSAKPPFYSPPCPGYLKVPISHSKCYSIIKNSITSGKSNRTPLSFYPLELYWQFSSAYFLFWEILNLNMTFAVIVTLNLPNVSSFPSPSPSRFISIFCSRPSFLCEVTRKRLYWFPEWAPDFFLPSVVQVTVALVFSDLEAMCS